ncbi:MULTISPECIES: ANTAR domain-containing protein [Rhodococcus]|uniref:ANTAR domain-containing protein n=1 Tax=Rhodococcus qingshengii JCM 15477 TaxID=1303681 RepID=A0AB38RPL3_RHOSG|nr:MULTISPECIES: ANTAR domain-containing protein [Rhodococcus]MDA3635331.1 ANTAR domain-containing protein [Rhodococcus sp. C-2]UPU46768.1 ANTAR domain-containing protein [Rhodococcus qingshengii JCM 15477]
MELEGLREAMKTQGIIEWAKGMWMAAHGGDEDRAFEVLVEQSQRRKIRLSALATELVETFPKR